MSWFKKMEKEDETLFKNEWISVKVKDGWFHYCHNEKIDGHGVAVLGWRNSGDTLEILGRYENCPSHEDDIALCALTGGIDDKKGEASALTYAQKELEEESGISVSKDRFKSLGTVRPNKQSDSTAHLFEIELPDEEPAKNPKGDGSTGEIGAYCRWVSSEEAINCKDPLVHVMMLRLRGVHLK